MTATPTANPSRASLYGLSFDALRERLERDGIRPAHTQPLWRALYGHLRTDLTSLESLPPPLQRWVAAEAASPDGLAPLPPRENERQLSDDGLTRKFLLSMADGQAVETVLMGYEGRFTACLSTQAGCAMGCVFCATGQMGFTRHLTPGEIVGQALHCQRDLRERGLSGLRNLVLMGMGEPLHNYDAVMQALEIITDTRGLNIGPSRITISTVGIAPAILRLAEERRPYNLAVSLHAATEEERAALVPASRRWSLAELVAACHAYCNGTGRKIFFQWTLIHGVNDTPGHAAKIAALLAGLNAHVNLIPLNPTAGYEATPTTPPGALDFQKALKAGGILSTVRQRRGIDVDAGCGQLKSARERRR